MKRVLLTILSLLLPASAALLAVDFRIAVIPVEFSDTYFTDTDLNVHTKIEQAKIYLDHQFSPRDTFHFDILPTVRLPYTMYTYGSNSTSRRDDRLDEAIRKACSDSKADFSKYDNDNDGTIDVICLITAGQSEADGYGASCIWPQQGWLHDRGGAMTLSDKTADCFIVCPEFASVGIFCHETCHIFGLVDTYDTDGRMSGGIAKGLWGRLSLMDNEGRLANFSAVEIEQLGLAATIDCKPGHYSLRPLSRSRDMLRMDSDNEDEYFLFECRDNGSWDSELGGAGLVVYHIDKSASNAWFSDAYRRNLTAKERWETNQVNCRPDHPCARVVEAVPGTESISEIFFPQPGHAALGSETEPPLRFWSGKTAPMALTNIAIEPDGNVSFDVVIPITITDTQVFQDAAIICWTLDPKINLRSCSVTISENGSTINRITTYPGRNGTCSTTLEGLKPQTDYFVTIRALCLDGSTFSTSFEFKTKVRTQVTRPFIFLNTVSRNEDGSFPPGSKFPLRIYNAQDVQAVNWYYNGLRIYPSSDGMWQLESSSGTMKAKIWYSDGSCEIITKELTVK